MNLPSKAVLEFSFLLFLHFVSSFPFLIYKQLVRKEVFPVVAWNKLQAVISQLSNVLDRSLFRSHSNPNFSLTAAIKNKRFLNKTPFSCRNCEFFWDFSRKPFKSFPRIWNFSELKIPKFDKGAQAAREFVFKVIDNLSWVIDFYWSVNNVWHVGGSAMVAGLLLKGSWFSSRRLFSSLPLPLPRFLRSPARTRERAPQKSKMALDYRTERVFRDETPSIRLQAGYLEAARYLTGKNLSTFVPRENFFVVPKRFKSEKHVFMQESGYSFSLISKDKDHKSLPVSPFLPRANSHVDHWLARENVQL